MIKNKEILSLKFLYPELFSDPSISSINYESFIQLDEKIMNQLFSIKEFKDLFIRNISQDLAERILNSLSILLIAGKKNTPFVNDEDLVLALLKSVDGSSNFSSDDIHDYFKMLNVELKNSEGVAYSFVSRNFRIFLDLNHNLKNTYWVAIAALENFRSIFYAGFKKYSNCYSDHRESFCQCLFKKFPVPGEKLMDNISFLKEAIQIEESIMDHASERHRGNIQLMAFYAQQANGTYAYENASYELKLNRDFIIICAKNGLSLKYLRQSLRGFNYNKNFNISSKDFDINLAAISHNGNEIKYACSEIKKDKKMALFALKNGANLENLDNFFKDDEEIVTEAIKLDGRNLRFASPRLRKDSKMISRAIKSNGDVLESLPGKKYRADKSLVIDAIKFSQRGNVFTYIHSSLKKDKEFILKAIKVYAEENAYINFHTYVPKNMFIPWWNSPNEHRPSMSPIINMINKELLKDKRFISRAAEICPNLLSCYGFPAKKIYKKVARKILQTNPFLFRYFDTNDESLALTALKQELGVAPYLGFRLKHKAKFKKYIEKKRLQLN